MNRVYAGQIGVDWMESMISELQWLETTFIIQWILMEETSDMTWEKNLMWLIDASYFSEHW